MGSLNDFIDEYTYQLSKGNLQKAYNGIMKFISEFRNVLINNQPEYTANAMYYGYMDMTYFAFTPIELKKRNLKIAVVYLHEKNRFEIWLCGGNKKVQSEYIELFNTKDLGRYKLSEVIPRVDSIIELQILEKPDFEKSEELMEKIEKEILEFTKAVYSFID